MRRILLPLLLVAAAPVAADTSRAELRALQQLDLKVATISHKLATANAALCPVKSQQTGLLLHALGQYAPSQRDAAKMELQVRPRATVLAVVPGSAADRAGLREGDEIAWINGRAVDQPVLPAAASYDSVGFVEDAILSALADGPVELMFVRHEFQRTALLQPDPACPSRVQVLPGKKLNAWADGVWVQLTTAMASQTRDDDELAFVIAHEMAHNILKHADTVKAARKNKAVVRETEEAADRLAVTLMAGAGFDAMGAPRLWAHFGKRKGAGLLSQGTHMRWADRVRFLTILAAPTPRLKPAQ